ncbi:MAG TPA: TetR/AcrR family transcriptional regulator [Lachnospiraceae bacterium]|nr:TetR/AcrR family transcriptional regulator [Lachnospiraceae bacterium]
MGEKSEQKKQFILETARKVFTEKGYKSVTMKDIVDACEISRGGLYLYFDSTEQLFMEVLKIEQADTDDTLEDALSKEATVTDILALFLKEQKKEILRGTNNLSIATYEFFFSKKFPKKENIARKKFELGVKLLSEMIDAGVANGEFFCEDSVAVGKNIMFVIEGLKVAARTIGVSEKTVDEQLLYMIQGLVYEEEE